MSAQGCTACIPPDNSRFYCDKLPGTKSLRIIPNTNHINILAFTVPSLISFVNRLNRNVSLPKLSTCIFKNRLTVHFSEKPVKITHVVSGIYHHQLKLAQVKI
ncbi:MAG: PhoPQ-activated protein PqaA family protein [Candidatus Arsenophonus phytopathogenicus]